MGLSYRKISNVPALSAKYAADRINQRRGFGKVPVNSKMYSSTLDRNALFDKFTSGQIDEKTYNIGLAKLLMMKIILPIQVY